MSDLTGDTFRQAFESQFGYRSFGTSFAVTKKSYYADPAVQITEIGAWAIKQGFCHQCLWDDKYTLPYFIKHKGPVKEHRWRNQWRGKCLKAGRVLKAPSRAAIALPASGEPQLPDWDGFETCDQANCTAPATHFTPHFAKPPEKTQAYVLWSIYVSRQNKAWCGEHKWRKDLPMIMVYDSDYWEVMNNVP